MANLKDIRDQIKSVKSIQKVTKAMKMVAAAKMRRAQDNMEKASKFFQDLKIKNLDLYFDSPQTLAKKFQLRGIPTTILINKDGHEFARVIGSTDFSDEKFLDWLVNFN